MYVYSFYLIHSSPLDSCCLKHREDSLGVAEKDSRALIPEFIDRKG
jgi:hypothetical protein